MLGNNVLINEHCIICPRHGRWQGRGGHCRARRHAAWCHEYGPQGNGCSQMWMRRRHQARRSLQVWCRCQARHRCRLWHCCRARCRCCVWHHHRVRGRHRVQRHCQARHTNNHSYIQQRGDNTPTFCGLWVDRSHLRAFAQ